MVVHSCTMQTKKTVRLSISLSVATRKALLKIVEAHPHHTLNSLINDIVEAKLAETETRQKTEATT